MSLKELRERLDEIVKEMRRIRDDYHRRKKEGKSGADLWPDEVRKRWVDLNQELPEVRAKIEEEKREAGLDQSIEELERSLEENRNGPSDEERRGEDRDRGRRDDDVLPNEFRSREEFIETRDLAMQAFLGRRSTRNRSERHVRAAERFGLDLNDNQLVINLYDTRQIRMLQSEYRFSRNAERRALSGHLGASGAFMIGNTLIDSIERNQLAFGGIESVSDMIVTDHGEEMSWPSADDTSNEGRIVGENPSSATETNPSFGAVKWFAHEFTSDLVKVPVRLLEDAPAVLASSLGDMLGERIGRAKNRKFTTGTGANQPKGAITAAALGVTAASATAIAADEIIQLEHAVDPSYRDEPGAGFMCHDNIVMEIRLLKDSEGRYLWKAGLEEGRPDRLNGRMLQVNQHMDSAMASGNKTLAYGAWRRYKVRRVRQLVILRLTERFAETRQEGFIAFVRCDGNLLNAGTNPLAYLQH